MPRVTLYARFLTCLNYGQHTTALPSFHSRIVHVQMQAHPFTPSVYLPDR